MGHRYSVTEVSVSKIKIKLRLQGFELEVEGERHEVASATQSISNQLANLMTPPNPIVSNGGSVGQPLIDVTPVLSPNDKKSSRKKSGSTVRGSNGKAAPAIDFVNVPARLGTPSQAWSLVQKAMWTLHVIAELKHVTSLSAGVIGRTFNKHFRQAGEIRPSNISRDLGKMKTKVGDTPPLVGEDTTKAPSEWFLVEEGTRQVRELISKSVGGSQAAA
jgi:hypothetical protein